MQWFEKVNKNVKNASDHIQRKRLRQLWCDLHQKSLLDKHLQYAIGIRVNGETMVLTAPSQGELLEIVKAKYIANPSLTGADTCIYNVQAGNLIADDGTTQNLEFNSSNQFWRCANADPLHGFTYPSTVDLTFQSPNTSKNIPATTDGTDVLSAALFGKSNIG